MSGGIGEGDIVVDRDADFPRNAALIVNRTEIPAAKVDIPELGTTVAEANPSYSEDAAVAMVAFVKELRKAIPDYDQRSAHGVREELRRVNVQTYSYPVPRLKAVQERGQELRADGGSGDDDDRPICRYCGTYIEEEGQRCPALDDGRCVP